MTLSIDIGYDYVAWAYQIDTALNYGIFKLGDDIRSGCVAALNSFHFNHLIIEKQVPLNKKCVKIQHYLEAIAQFKSISSGNRITISIQHARTKFKRLGEQPVFRGKLHKQLSVDMALEYLSSGEIVDCASIKFKDYCKQDDIADAINMLRAEQIKIEE
jgi:hypothetical protein